MKLLTTEQSIEILSKVQCLREELQQNYGTEIHLNVSGIHLKAYSLTEIFVSVCTANNFLTEAVLNIKKKSSELGAIRQAYCLLAKTYTNCPLEQIAKRINRDRSSVYYNIYTAKNLMDINDPLFMSVFNKAQDYLISTYSK